VPIGVRFGVKEATKEVFQQADSFQDVGEYRHGEGPGQLGAPAQSTISLNSDYVSVVVEAKMRAFRSTVR
jgi:hypothetical protein